MKILVTGAKGFVGRNLCLELNNIREGKSRCWGLLPASQNPSTQNPSAQNLFAQAPAQLAQPLSAAYPSTQALAAQPASQNPASQNPAQSFAQAPAQLAQPLLAAQPASQNPSAQTPAHLAAQNPSTQSPAAQPSAQNLPTSHPLTIDCVYEYDIDSAPEELDAACRDADFVFNLAGVNRPQNTDDFMKGNFGFASTLLDTLKKHGNTCPVMLSSSQQASLTGRFGNSEYGRSKKAGEDLFLQYGAQTGAEVLVYRFPNLFGKWCRPNYNSAVATFCNNVANDLPITVNDPSVELELLYIDDLIAEMIAAIKGEPHRCEFDGLKVIPDPGGRYCYCPVTHKATLGQITALLQAFHDQPRTLEIPQIPEGSFPKKLYSTYLSYLPREKAAYPLKMNVDPRGSFTELIRFAGAGQVSVNISRPGITKGQHWHHSKWELFVVVKGHGLIQERKEGTGEIIEFEVSGESIQAVHMLPGYTHNIINLSDTEDLVTVMYCNEHFDPDRPDTYGDPVLK